MNTRPGYDDAIARVRTALDGLRMPPESVALADADGARLREHAQDLLRSDDVRGLEDLIGVDHVLFGSDFPHAEGLKRPLDFLKELEGFSEAAVRRIMRDNARFITTPRPASKAA